jgi:hypothetical protein
MGKVWNAVVGFATDMTGIIEDIREEDCGQEVMGASSSGISRTVTPRMESLL